MKGYDNKFEDLTGFFEHVDLSKVIQGEFLPRSFFETRLSRYYDLLKYEIMDIGAVGIIVNNDKTDINKCILGISRKNDKKDFGLPGGKSDDKENIIDTLRREIFEETGLVVKEYKLVYAAKAIDKLCFTFICSCENLKFENKEADLGVDLKWIGLGDLLIKNFSQICNVIDNRPNYSPELYWKLLNNSLVNLQKSTFSNYNFRTLRKLLNFIKIEICKKNEEEAKRIYGNFSDEIFFLYDCLLADAKYLNMIEPENF